MRGPLPAPGYRFNGRLCTAQFSFEFISSYRFLEMNHDTRRRAQIVLRLIVGSPFVKPRQQIIHLQRPQRESIRKPVVNASTDGHRKRVLRRSKRAPAYARSRVRYSEESFGKRRKVSVAAIGNTRAEEVSRECSVDFGAQNISVVIAAEIRDATDPILDVIRHRCASAVQAEAVPTPRDGIFTHVRIPGEHINLWRFLRVRNPSAQGKKGH